MTRTTYKHVIVLKVMDELFAEKEEEIKNKLYELNKTNNRIQNQRYSIGFIYKGQKINPKNYDKRTGSYYVLHPSLEKEAEELIAEKNEFYINKNRVKHFVTLILNETDYLKDYEFVFPEVVYEIITQYKTHINSKENPLRPSSDYLNRLKEDNREVISIIKRTQVIKLLES